MWSSVCEVVLVPYVSAVVVTVVPILLFVLGGRVTAMLVRGTGKVLLG